MIRIVESEFIKSGVKPEHYPSSEFADIAFVGKSNVGKSSLINTLLNRKALAKISSRPGKTKLVNFFKIRYKNADEDSGFVNFVDLPGYGYAKVSKNEKESWKKMMRDYFTQRLQLRGVVALVDIRHDPDAKDEVMINMLKDAGIPYLLAVTKSDKLSKNKAKSQLMKLKKHYSAEYACSFSALKKIGIEQITDWIEKIIL